MGRGADRPDAEIAYIDQVSCVSLHSPLRGSSPYDSGLMDAFNEYFVDVIKNHYIDFEGRARRKQYWMFVLFQILIAVALLAVAGILAAVSDVLGGLFVLLYYVVSLGLFLPALGLGVRRLHDTGKSGWFFLVVLIPFLGALALLYFMVIEGDAGPNEYGPDPKDPYAEDLSNVLDVY